MHNSYFQKTIQFSKLQYAILNWKLFFFAGTKIRFILEFQIWRALIERIFSFKNQNMIIKKV